MNHAQLRLRTGLLYQLSQLTPSPWVGSILGKSLRQVLSCWRRTASEYTRKGSFWLSAKYLSKTKVQREFLENIQSELWIQIRIIFLSWIRIQERKNWEKKQKKWTEIGNNYILIKFVIKFGPAPRLLIFIILSYFFVVFSSRKLFIRKKFLQICLRWIRIRIKNRWIRIRKKLMRIHSPASSFTAQRQKGVIYQ